MAKEVLLFNGAAIPAHIAKRMAEAPVNIEDRVTIPMLVTLGKGAFGIVLNGETTRIQKRDAEGDLIDMPIFRGIILDWAKRRGRTYYDGPYDKDKPGKPACWSEDGITRDPHGATQPVTDGGELVTKCGNCPFAVKGSKINELGKPTTACGEHRMLAVIPHSKPDFTPLRLKLSITSDYDGQSPELEAEDWFAFSNYKDAMRARGVTNTAFIITKIRFDPNKTFPKLIFQWGGWVEELHGSEIQDKLLEIAASPEVQALLSGSWGSDATAAPETKALPKAAVKAANDDEPAPAKKRPPPPPPEEPAPKAKPKKVVPDDDDEAENLRGKPFTEDDIELAATAKANQAAVAAKQAAKKKAAEADDDGEVVMTGKAKPKEATAPKKETPPVSANMKSLMGKWGDDDD